MQKQIHKPLLLIFSLFTYSLFCNEIDQLREMAQKSFISGKYAEANLHFTNICIHHNSSEDQKKYAYRMKALLLEQYLAEIDSAIEINILYRDKFCSTPREVKVIENKIHFLKSLGSRKMSYGEYQKIIFTNSDDLSRTKSLTMFLKENPNFFKRKEALKQCAIAALNCKVFRIAYKSYKEIKKEYPPLSRTETTQFKMSRRMYHRFLFHKFVFVIWILTSILIAFEISQILRKYYSKPILPTTPIIVWLIILSIFILTYTFKIYHSDHNPFRISDMIIMASVFTISILFNGFIVLNSKNRIYKRIVLSLTTLTIIGTAFFTTYNRPDKITVMEDLYDQIGDVFIKDKSIEKGKNIKD